YYISKVKKGTEEHVILGEVKNLFDWYSTFTSHLDSEESPDLRKTVEGLTQDLATEEEKVQAIFYWVQDNIKYIAFEEGMRGFIPHNANYIFSNRYGDCKDMACITRSMLKIAGINSYFTWIGSRDIPYSYEEVPTPIVDNHMIATYYKDGDPQFLDATSKYTQYGLPSSMIQGKQALVQTGPDSYRLETVPVIDRKVNFKRDSSIIKISNGRVIGNGILSEGGYEKIFDTYRITFASGTKLDELIKAKLTRGSNKFLLENYNLTNLTNKDLPLEITYSFNIQDYYKQIGDEIYLNLNLSKPFFNQLIDIERRKYPIETEYKYEHTYITTLEIPNGYEIEHLPRNSEFMNEVAGYSINYELLGSKVILRKTVFVEYLILALEKFPAWNDVINKINEAYTDALILKKK
ncbi:MAG TPA: transglutaminase-like domain-containing protein, partial [Cyclobacteriaceae bacterium]